jgi:hypothetical protein
MTGIIDARPLPEGSSPRPRPSALVEQATGVLIFRYSIAAEAALSLLELWAAQTNASVEQVAHAVVHEICQGDRSEPSDPGLVRWLEERLRHEFPGVECEGSS